ncbi:ISAs1 family transposase [Kineosporia sp. J2-2]|uniref:ISAs1 family transposase n=1 Tax=Kineosporia corallincola TaxID=2835133 RepID=A0ABS5TU53_9ACTN|nr:ISAs1 family transposase [Kineosporia corallincola]MBT0774322.1 ISAs1 family transposase [Kineosporia corallincola]
MISDEFTDLKITESDHRGLRERLEEVPDPRDPRGVRYPLASLLTIAVCAVIAGAVTFAAVGDWIEDLGEEYLADIGLTGARPVNTTLWRVLTRVDSVALSSVLATWLLSRKGLSGNMPAESAAGSIEPGTSGPAVIARRVIAVDGKAIRGTVRADGRYVHLLAAYDVATGVTLAQIPVGDKGGETGHFTVLMDQVEAVLGGRESLEGAVVVADALHAQTTHAHDLAARGAVLFVRVKANQETLHNQLKRLPWKDIPVGHRTRDAVHGRRETRTLKALTLQEPLALAFPHAVQAVRITRTRIIKGKTTRDTAYLIISLPHEHAGAATLNLWARQEWHIENRLHWVKDMTLREDEHRATTGQGPAVFAVLRNTAIGFHRLEDQTNIARATRGASRQTGPLIRAVTSNGTTTQ